MSAPRILLVEDDDDIRSIALLALEQLGRYEVLACASGAQALAQAAQFCPDLLLLDVSMPDMDGPETLAALRQQTALALVPVAFLTAHTAAKQVSQYRALNAVDVIAKPFDPMQLCERINAILANPLTIRTSSLIPADNTHGLLALVLEDDPIICYQLGTVLPQQG